MTIRSKIRSVFGGKKERDSYTTYSPYPDLEPASPSYQSPNVLHKNNYTTSTGVYANPGTPSTISELPSTPQSKHYSPAPSTAYSSPSPPSNRSYSNSYFASPANNSTLPPCRHCGQPNALQRVRYNTGNPNSRRPYRQCTNQECNEFNGFADGRGLGQENPECDCGMGSRKVVKKQQNGGRRGVFYTCQLSTCGFYMNGTEMLDYEEVQAAVRRGEL